MNQTKKAEAYHQNTDHTTQEPVELETHQGAGDVEMSTTGAGEAEAETANEEA